MRLPFKLLTAKDLMDYYYLASEHVGSVGDLRHYLPKSSI
jgi:hypothetical protein